MASARRQTERCSLASLASLAPPLGLTVPFGHDEGRLGQRTLINDGRASLFGEPS